MAYVNQAGEIKIKNNVTKAVDNKRAEEVLINAEELGKKEGLPVGFAKNVFQTIVTESAKHEQEHMEKIKKINLLKRESRIYFLLHIFKFFHI